MYEIKIREKKYVRIIDILIYLILKQYICHDASSLSNRIRRVILLIAFADPRYVSFLPRLDEHVRFSKTKRVQN